MSQYNTSLKLKRILCVLIFVFLLYANLMTPRIVDDFIYSFSFATDRPVRSLLDIIPSMHAHASTMNGRIFAHTLVQVMDFIPPVLFDIINSAAFLGLVGVSCMYCRTEKKQNNLLFCVLFGAIWIFTPAFGQVFLWLDGSCNYGWGTLLTLCWLIPYVHGFLYSDSCSTGLWVVFCIIGFFHGGYLENTSAAGIFMAILLLLLTRLYKKRPTGFLPWIGIVSGMGGYLYMITRPAENIKSTGGGFLEAIPKNFLTVLDTYAELKILLFFYAAALALCCWLRTDRDRRILSFVFLLGSLCANFIMVFAIWYRPRCMIFPTLSLIVACGILFADLMASRAKPVMLCVSAILAVSLVSYMMYGMADITNTGVDLRTNESKIITARDGEKMDVAVPLITTYSKYSPVNGLKYLDTKDAGSWPNDYMAKCLGVNSIIGY